VAEAGPEQAAAAPDQSQERDLLDAIGAEIGDPDTLAEDAAREVLGEPAVSGFGRLAGLALWWASVRGEADPGAPGRTLLAGGGLDVADRRPGVQVIGWPLGGSVDDALAWGVAAADDAADRGVELVLLCLADPGAAIALTAELTGLDAVEATGWPTDLGLSDEDWMDQVVALRDLLRRTRGLRGRPCDLLRALGSPATAAAAGFAVRATARRTPILLDGPGAAAVALLARRTSFPAAAWWQAAHLGSHHLHERALGSLGLEPLTRLGITVEDGTAAMAGLAILDQAAALLRSSSSAPDDDAV
jgi:hypothetical protein